MGTMSDCFFFFHFSDMHNNFHYSLLIQIHVEPILGFRIFIHAASIGLVSPREKMFIYHPQKFPIVALKIAFLSRNTNIFLVIYIFSCYFCVSFLLFVITCTVFYFEAFHVI